MKKHGERMELIGMLALLLTAMASDGGALGLLPLALLAAVSIGLILVGHLFTRPCPRAIRIPSARRMTDAVPGRVCAAPLGRAA